MNVYQLNYKIIYFHGSQIKFQDLRILIKYLYHIILDYTTIIVIVIFFFLTIIEVIEVVSSDTKLLYKCIM